MCCTMFANKVEIKGTPLSPEAKTNELGLHINTITTGSGIARPGAPIRFWSR